MNLPNLISLARLLAVPLIVWLIIEQRFAVAFWVFVAAGASDAIDGFIAKRFNAVSKLGEVLDPLADKVLLMAVYIALGRDGRIETWLVILVVSRDLLILGGVVLGLGFSQSIKVSPLKISKLNTAAQIALACLVLAGLGLGWKVQGMIDPLVYAVALTTVLSGAAYLVRWARGADETRGLQ